MEKIFIPIIDRDGQIKYLVENPKQREYKFLVSISFVSSSKNRLRNITLSMFIPPDDPHQKLLNIKTNFPSEIKHDSLGNRIWNVTIDVVPPRKHEELSLISDLLLRPYSINDDWGELKNNSSGHKDKGRLQRFDTPEIRKILDELELMHTKSIKEIVIRTLRYIRRNIRYFKAPYRLGAMFALKHKKGSCDEISDLMVAILRARGVDVRSVIGYYVGGSLHEWIEVKTNAGWIPVDPTIGLFGGLGSKWIKIFVEPKPSTRILMVHGEGRGLMNISVRVDNSVVLNKKLWTPRKTPWKITI